MEVVSIFQSLIGENILSFRIQADGSSVDAPQITRMYFPAQPLPKMESKDALNNCRPRIFGPSQTVNFCQQVRRKREGSRLFHRTKMISQTHCG